MSIQRLHHIKKQYSRTSQQEIHTIVDFDTEENTWIQLYEIYAFDTGHGHRTDLTHILDEEYVNAIDWPKVLEDKMADAEPETHEVSIGSPKQKFLTVFTTA